MSPKGLALRPVLLVAGWLAAGPCAAQVIGQVTMVRNGSGPAVTEVRPLQAGSDARVATGPNDRAQLLLLDGTALTVGPGAEAAVEAFAYDAATGAGRLSLRGSDGDFRLVGGRIGKSTEVLFHLPAVTLGIRGGVALAGATGATFLYGDGMTVRSRGQQVSVQRPGFGVDFNASGELSLPHPIDPSALAQRLASLEGGAAARPTTGTAMPTVERSLAATALAALGSAAVPPSPPVSVATIAPPLPDTTVASRAVREATVLAGPVGATVQVPVVNSAGVRTGQTVGVGVTRSGDGTLTLDTATATALFARNVSLSGTASSSIGVISSSAGFFTTPHGASSGGFFVAGKAGSDTVLLGSGFPGANTLGLPFGLTTLNLPVVPATTQTLNGYFAGLLQASGGLSVFRNQAADDVTQFSIDTNAQSLRLSAAMHAAGSSGDVYVLSYGGGGFLSGSSSSFLNDRIFVAVQAAAPATKQGTPASSSQLYLITSSFAPTAFLNVTPCTCEFVQWGFFGADLQFPTGREQVQLGQWVAGKVPNAAQVPVSGTATYVGHVVGDVLNGGASFKQGGAFNLAYQFASRSGNFQITGFDGYAISGPMVSAPATANKYSGAIAGTGGSSGALSGTAAGAFFSSPNDPVIGTGGQFTVQNAGQTYKATGIFLGQR